MRWLHDPANLPTLVVLCLVELSLLGYMALRLTFLIGWLLECGAKGLTRVYRWYRWTKLPPAAQALYYLWGRGWYAPHRASVFRAYGKGQPIITKAVHYDPPQAFIL